MKLSTEGRFRSAVQAAFVSGLAVASFAVFAQEPTPIVVAPAESAAPVAPEAAAALAPATVDTLPVAETSVSVASTTSAEKSIATVELKKIAITGSRIKSPNLTSSSPITTVNSAEIKFQGTTRVEDLLNSLP
ncbi:MAG: hypothetical protein Q7J29_00220, partial [Stagnimonas sp.]|nr:hypothetical protein [Stagnimonas sp.]